jgi:hypothetical protein
MRLAGGFGRNLPRQAVPAGSPPARRLVRFAGARAKAARAKAAGAMIQILGKCRHFKFDEKTRRNWPKTSLHRQRQVQACLLDLV